MTRKHSSGWISEWQVWRDKSQQAQMNAMHGSTECGPGFFLWICYLLLRLCTWVCVPCFFCADTDPSEPLAVVMRLVRISHHSKRPPNDFLCCVVRVIFLWFISAGIYFLIRLTIRILPLALGSFFFFCWINAHLRFFSTERGLEKVQNHQRTSDRTAELLNLNLVQILRYFPKRLAGMMRVRDYRTKQVCLSIFKRLQ